MSRARFCYKATGRAGSRQSRWLDALPRRTIHAGPATNRLLHTCDDSAIGYDALGPFRRMQDEALHLAATQGAATRARRWRSLQPSRTARNQTFPPHHAIAARPGTVRRRAATTSPDCRRGYLLPLAQSITAPSDKNGVYYKLPVASSRRPKNAPISKKPIARASPPRCVACGRR
jgi:hypothetical protein